MLRDDTCAVCWAEKNTADTRRNADLIDAPTCSLCKKVNGHLTEIQLHEDEVADFGPELRICQKCLQQELKEGNIVRNGED